VLTGLPWNVCDGKSVGAIYIAVQMRRFLPNWKNTERKARDQINFRPSKIISFCHHKGNKNDFKLISKFISHPKQGTQMSGVKNGMLRNINGSKRECTRTMDKEQNHLFQNLFSENF